ncbi:Gfo/Idh/MocA family protein [Paenibacillus aceris]|uniref:Dehydrogenase n=1 Tax=Paenibacillus aceris TaxID=869555 RepID=A0ABS4I7J9_9BACL|nr:Gfo/Idh/MocA family oxidoreductase [Paenibacillus aceris]MBP1966491.1 putative dehydrogenase [Paenibacillus aceris]NHW39532.1 Gfo/Idh/MocA family oxidoreductase [Paenibacillus aceris]
MKKETWNFGIIGLGGIGDYHMNHLSKIPYTRVGAICDVNEKAVEQVGNRLNLPAEKRYTAFKAIIDDPEIDVILSGVSNKFHYEILKYALACGKPVFSEKPFTRTLEEADELASMYEKNPIPCMIGFSYRYRPCFQYVKQLVAQGALGRIRHFAAHYLQEENAPMFNKEYTWRFNKEMAGSGILADIGSHMVDAARFFVGEFVQVSGMMSTFIDRRRDLRTGELVAVDVDDFTGFQCVLEGGVMGTFYTHKNAIGTKNQFEVTLFGDLGTARISVERPNEVHLTVREGEKMELTEKVIHLDEKEMKPMLQDFVDYLEQAHSTLLPTLHDGYRNQQVLQAIIDSAKDGITRSL